MRQLGRLAVLLMVCSCVSFAQDNTGSDNWGRWKVMNPRYPYLSARVRCTDDVLQNGRWESSWDFEIRSGYRDPVDFVYYDEYASPKTLRNEKSGAYLARNLGPSQSVQYPTVLYGRCSQHMTEATGLHLAAKCVATSGQDDPCLTENGKPIQEHPHNVNAGKTRSPHMPNVFGKRWQCDPTQETIEAMHPVDDNENRGLQFTVQPDGTLDCWMTWDAKLIQEPAYFKLQWRMESDGTFVILNPDYKDYYITWSGARAGTGYWVFTDKNLETWNDTSGNAARVKGRKFPVSCTVLN